MNDLISVIVPIYNVEKYLNKCLESIINQTYNNLEIILIDDGSTDSSGKICDEWAQNDKRIVVKHVKNGGVSKARNIGLDFANGKYIGFVDPDDFLSLDMYSELINKINSDDYSIVCCNHFYGSEQNFKKYIPIENDIIMNNIEYQEFSLKYGGTLWNRLYKKELIDKIRFSDNIVILEDLLFNLEVSNSNIKVYYLSKCLYYYFKNQNGALRTKNSKKIISSFYAQERIMNIAKKNKLSYLNILKLNYIFSFKYNHDCIINDANSFNHFMKVAKKIINEKIFLKKAPLILKFKTFIIWCFPKSYIFIKKVIK